MYNPLFLLFLLIGICNLKAQSQTTFCKQIKALDQLIKKEHFKSKPIDDSLSIHVHDLFLSFLDPNKIYYTKKDIDDFKNDRKMLDDYIINNDCAFIEKYNSILKHRILNSITIIDKLKDKALTYNGKDSLHFKPKEELDYMINDEKVNLYWSKRIRKNIITEIFEQDSILHTIKQNFIHLEKTLKPKIIANTKCLLEEKLGSKNHLEQFVKEAFLNAFANYHDPNTRFFNHTDKLIFDNTISNSKESFGFSTSKNNNGEIIVSYITTGGPAHKSGKIEVNDIIKSLKSGNKTIETYCISNEEIQYFTNNKSHKKITFKIKKPNGTIISTELQKEEIKVEENTITGFILKANTKVGYINIPSFYTDLESPRGLGLANDIAKELYKLEKEDIQGLILDLRNNGGGSLKEASDLSGMFINRGPLSIHINSHENTYTLKDQNRGSLFSKPLVVMVNNFSASASEYFASIMQDYNRAIIVGTTTHGKSSVQVVLPINNDETLGYGKVTIERFYRPTGKSFQSQGVIPTIRFPSFYDGFNTEEKYKSHALKNDSISPTLNLIPLSKLPVKELRKLSIERTKNNNGFIATKKINTLIHNHFLNKRGSYPLTLEHIYEDYYYGLTQWNTLSLTIKNYLSSLDVKNNKSYEEFLSYDPDLKATNRVIISDHKSDFFIEEAHNILTDFIHINN